MKILRGDLVDYAATGRFDVIIHGCNCFHTMGAGIAKLIASQFPEALIADKETSHGDISKLGSYSTAKVLRGATKFTIVNAYTQHQWRGRGRKVSYDAIQSCFEKISTEFKEARIGYPQIGAGLAGGDWDIISDIIDEALSDCDHTLVLFDG